jgi:hypothetical protein
MNLLGVSKINEFFSEGWFELATNFTGYVTVDIVVDDNAFGKSLSLTLFLFLLILLRFLLMRCLVWKSDNDLDLLLTDSKNCQSEYSEVVDSAFFWDPSKYISSLPFIIYSLPHTPLFTSAYVQIIK